jgi:hypothetical protein
LAVITQRQLGNRPAMLFSILGRGRNTQALNAINTGNLSLRIPPAGERTNLPGVHHRRKENPPTLYLSTALLAEPSSYTTLPYLLSSFSFVMSSVYYYKMKLSVGWIYKYKYK